MHLLLNPIIKAQELSRVLKKDQWDALCPPAESDGKHRSCSDDWDITLICVVVINTEGLPTPDGGTWKIKKAGTKYSISLHE